MKIVGSILKWLGIGIYAVCAVLIVIFLMPVGGWKALNVLTGSMRPAIQPGALVIIHKVPLSSLKPGDIITYSNPANTRQTITHRLVKITTVDGIKTLVVKGDANPSPDKPFPAALVVGREVMVVPAAGHLTNWLHSPLGLAALVVIPGVVVIWAEVRRLSHTLGVNPKPAPESNMPPPGPPNAPLAPESPAAPQAVPKPRARRRNLDGMQTRRIGVLLVVAALLLSTHPAEAKHRPAPHPHASTHVGAVRLVHNILHAYKKAPKEPDDREDCQKNHWKIYKNPDGSQRFKNQGQCISFVNSLRHPKPESHHGHDSDGDDDND
jgi:signal peptidase I